MVRDSMVESRSCMHHVPACHKVRLHVVCNEIHDVYSLPDYDCSSMWQLVGISCTFSDSGRKWALRFCNPSESAVQPPPNVPCDNLLMPFTVKTPGPNAGGSPRKRNACHSSGIMKVLVRVSGSNQRIIPITSTFTSFTVIADVSECKV